LQEKGITYFTIYLSTMQICIYTHEDLYERGSHGQLPRTLTIIGMFCVRLEFPPRMNNWNFRHFAGYLNCITKKVSLQTVLYIAGSAIYSIC